MKKKIVGKKIVEAVPLEQGLLDEAKRLKKQAKKMPPGEDRESLLRKAQENEETARMIKWLNSPEPEDTLE